MDKPSVVTLIDEILENEVSIRADFNSQLYISIAERIWNSYAVHIGIPIDAAVDDETKRHY